MAGGRSLVFVYDPSDSDVIPVDKQTRNPRHIWYRPCSGIWQKVWLESVPGDYISQLDVTANMYGTGECACPQAAEWAGPGVLTAWPVTLTAHSSQRRGSPVQVSIYNRDGHLVARRSGNADTELRIEVDNPELWEPSSPTLYNMTITMGDDEVQSYTGFRTISNGRSSTATSSSCLVRWIKATGPTGCTRCPVERPCSRSDVLDQG